jgi:hypothetical protein
MISIDKFFSRVMPYVQGCPEPTASQAILDAAIDFCDSTAVMRRSLDTFYTRADLNDYDLDTPHKSLRIAKILAVRLDGDPISGVFEEDSYRLSVREGKPTGFYTRRIDETLTLRFNVLPDARYPVEVSASFAPTRSATVVENDLFDYWGDAIAMEAIARLSGMPETLFSNPALSVEMSNRARAQRHEARIESFQGKVRGGSRVKIRPLVR